VTREQARERFGNDAESDLRTREIRHLPKPGEHVPPNSRPA
jgi:hypothetical protein